MAKNSFFIFVKEILLIIIVSMLGFVGIIFTVLYVETFRTDFYLKYNTLIVSLSVGIITLLTILTLVFMRGKKGFIYKLFFISVFIVSTVSLSLYFLKVSGFLDKIDSVEDFREYIQSYGNLAVVLFIALQFAQVVILPIPSFITVGAGVLLFGPLKSSLYSCIGIITGSIVAYFIGRVFGYKVVKWLVGKDTLDKALKTIKGKDKLILTFMFLFPFFPDDVLCFVAGITTIKPRFFIVMISIVRLITITLSSFSINNSIIPYDTWWGLLTWAIIFIAVLTTTIIVYKHGNTINKRISKFFKKKVKIK